MNISENINLYEDCCEKGVNARYFEQVKDYLRLRVLLAQKTSRAFLL